MEDAKRQTRRRHSSELKALVLGQCAKPGASVARVAMAHGLNANVVHKWRRQSDGGSAKSKNREVSTFIPLSLPASQAAPVADIRIELRRGATAVNVTWPMAGAAECAAWMRELLR
jgi:transposase